MKNFLISPSQIFGRVTPPPSKSETMRALAFSSMAKGNSEIIFPLVSPDVTAMKNALKKIGAKIFDNEKGLIVQGTMGSPVGKNCVIDAQNSGLVLRFLAAMSLLQEDEILIQGDESLQTRRFLEPFLKAVNDLGGFAISLNQNGRVPIKIRGPLKNNSVKINGEDSQNVTALIFASALRENVQTTIEISSKKEAAYIDMTLSWLEKLGISYEKKEHDILTILGKKYFPSFTYQVSKDWTQAAYLAALGVLTKGEITIDNLDFEEKGSDQGWLKLFQTLGISIEIKEGKLIINKSVKKLLGGKILDLDSSIDTLPLFALLGTQANDKIILTNAKIARFKESDRIEAITKELSKMGAKIETREDGLVVYPSSLHGAVVESHHDHRIVLTLFLAGLIAKGSTRINDGLIVEKSYPNFVQEMQKLGAKIAIV